MQSASAACQGYAEGCKALSNPGGLVMVQHLAVNLAGSSKNKQTEVEEVHAGVLSNDAAESNLPSCEPPKELIAEADLHARYNETRVDQMIQNGLVERRNLPEGVQYLIEVTWPGNWMSSKLLHEKYDNASIEEMLAQGVITTRQNPDCPERTQYRDWSNKAEEKLKSAEAKEVEAKHVVDDTDQHEEETKEEERKAEEDAQKAKEANVQKHDEMKVQKHGKAKNREGTLHKHKADVQKHREANAQKHGEAKVHTHGHAKNHEGKLQKHDDEAAHVKKHEEAKMQNQEEAEVQKHAKADANVVVGSEVTEKSSALPARALTTFVTTVAMAFVA